MSGSGTRWRRRIRGPEPMPFDSTSLRRPTVTILPPTPPERGGPQRIHVQIEIVDRRAQAPQRRLTRYQGIDGNGEPWTGTSYQSGFMTYFDANGPHGEQQHCRSWQQGWQTITECD